MGVLEDFRGQCCRPGYNTAHLLHREKSDLSPAGTAVLCCAGVTSTITLVETLVHPIRHNYHEIARRYREILLNTSHLTTFDVSPDIAQKAAEIRANYQLRTPDAIQLAAALQGGATFFLTNDHGLQKFPEINVIVVDDLA